MPAIVLATLNAKYIHASLGLRCLRANMGALRDQTQIREFTILQKPVEIVERLLSSGEPPQIVGFGVYIWNVVETTRVVRLLKALRPQLRIVLGGPEVSHETAEQEICRLADHVITGWGDVSFPKLCQALLHGPRPLTKVIAGEQPPLDTLALPYDEYTDDDLAHRLVYVEASRGCPFKCEFCLSSLDKTAWAFDLDRFLAALERLHRRGARHFKFVDRTFNLKIEASARILAFFLERLDDRLFVHFEVVPDHLPERLRQLIAQFPPGSLQFEVGIQSFDAEVQARISRRQDNDKTAENLRWLVTHSQTHVHADLIFGLPGETLASFAAGFDRLVALAPHEIQVGILKRLRGTPIVRHTATHAMVYDPEPPYAILQNDCVDFATVQRLQRFARYWDLVANAGRLPRALALLLGDAPFARFAAFSDALWQRTGKTHQIAYEDLVDALFEHLCDGLGLATDSVRETLRLDYQASGARGKPRCLDTGAPLRERRPGAKPLAQRQARRQHDRLPAGSPD
ncbi:B12-binding domain-containing radical SAM protein [Caldimonas brevitalea]|uniref:Radical SAM protein n=1 Tax=Caldimonas brevitalea TaxID=413882 RepID=A0A0G3BYW5_9BURK|nr:B12-binding domain-containing radical SAM protein [Caldimonas brevitalea]AKJ31720.1 radical SAM protein [Caldimonas brevitalea]